MEEGEGDGESVEENGGGGGGGDEGGRRVGVKRPKPPKQQLGGPESEQEQEQQQQRGPADGGWMPSGSVWEHVEVIAEEDSVMALWGDVTLVYLEVSRVCMCVSVCVCVFVLRIHATG
jgi:hypothetical protein